MVEQEYPAIPAYREQGSWRSYDATDGLAAGVKCLAQDDRGYLWLGTSAGLCRFDGEKFITFRVKDGLPDDEIQALTVDHRGWLWIGTRNGGGAWYDGQAFFSLAVSHGLSDKTVMEIRQDSRRRFWFATERGVAMLDGKRLIRLGAAEGLLCGETRAICEDNHGHIWFATDSGLFEYDGDHVQKLTAKDGLGSDNLWCVMCDSRGRIWCGGQGGGVSCYSRGRFVIYTMADGLPGNNCRAIGEDRNGNLWFCLWEAGVVRFDGDNFSLYSSRNALLENRTHAFLEDHDGSLWFALPLAGVSCFNPYSFETLASEPVSETLMKDQAGALWFGSVHHLCCLEGGVVRKRRFEHRVMSVAQDRAGRLWVATSEGLRRFDSPAAVWSSPGALLTTEHGLPCNDIKALMVSRDGALWIGTGSPGHLCRLLGDEVRVIDAPQRVVFRIVEDREGRIWFGGFEGGGLSCYDGETLRTYTEDDGLLDNRVQSLVEDDDGRLWIGTQKGLAVFDGMEFASFGAFQGFVSLFHQRSCKDARGNLWFATILGGLYRTDGQHFQWLTWEDGLLSNGITELWPEADGAVIIGTYRGIMRYRPRLSRPPFVMIRNVFALDNYRDPTYVELTSQQARSVTISYGGVGITTTHMRYVFKLDGYDRDWRETWENEVTYDALPEGDYNFQVIAMNRELVRTEEPAHVRIRVVQDPWVRREAEYEARIDEMAREIELRRQGEQLNSALVSLARSKALDRGDLAETFREITERATGALRVERASVWIFNEQQTAATCYDLYLRHRMEHLGGATFERAVFEKYVQSMDHQRAIVSSDVLNDPRYAEFDQKYFQRFNITASLDALVRLGGRKVGLVRLEHTGGPRTWTVEEERFVSSLADLVSLAIETHEVRQAAEERRKMETRIQNAQKLESLGVLAGGIAHDFNNLLMGILGNADLAMLNLDAAAPARKNIERIQTAGLRAAELTNQMLAYAGKGNVVVRALSLSGAVEGLIHLIKASVPRKIEIDFDLDKDLPFIEADITQIRQVIMNLIINAAEAIEDKAGRIIIRTGRRIIDAGIQSTAYLDRELPEGGYVFLEVEDTGCGISQDALERVFDPFYTTKFMGRGLGLAAVSGIIRQHNGAIMVRSHHDEGTCFTVLLPPVERVDEPVDENAVSEPLTFGGGTVLVVDDEDYVRNVARETLEQYGFTVLTAVDGIDGITSFRRHRGEVSVVLLDMTMPRLDGIETLKELKRLDPDIPVILSSGYAEEEAALDVDGDMLAGFIQKPYKPVTLLAKVHAAITGSRRTTR